MSSSVAGKYVQPSLEDLGTPLSCVTFMVVDLETTGVSSDSCAITEIGAVKVRGGEILGEYSTLVNPLEHIDPRVQALTGISDEMVAHAPTIEAVLPSFAEFAAGATWVAHNAPFDVGFLRAAYTQCDIPWPRPQVVDTVTLARRLLDRSEVANKKLSTLARFFGADTSPDHRALHDAKATVDVLHGLLERLGGHYVLTDTDLVDFMRAIPAAHQAKKRHLARDLPRGPGVYIFKDENESPLYVGVSNDVATRVRSYFSGAERRSRMRNMINATHAIDAIECAHDLEARVRELQLIGATKPPYNRRSKYPERLTWIRLTSEPYPRLSLSRKPPLTTSTALGPFTSRQHAHEAMQAIWDAMPLRQCTTRLSPHRPGPSCALADLGCPAPCELKIDVPQYDRIVHNLVEALSTDATAIVEPLLDRITRLAGEQRFEDAAEVRQRLSSLLHGVVRMQQARSLISIPNLIAARRATTGGWELASIRHGRLAGADVTPARTDPMPYVDKLEVSSTTIIDDAYVRAGGHVAETELVLKWLESAHTRLVRSDSGWHLPIRSAARHAALLEKLSAPKDTYRW